MRGGGYAVGAALSSGCAPAPKLEPAIAWRHDFITSGPDAARGPDAAMSVAASSATRCQSSAGRASSVLYSQCDALPCSA